MSLVPSSRDATLPDAVPSSRLRRNLPLLVGIIVSASFTYLFARSLSLEVLKDLPSRIRYDLVGIAALIFVAEFPIRALRWQILMTPLGRVPFRPLMNMTFIGFMANNLLPARAGEFVRPALVARRLSLPLTPVLVTTVMERVFDLMGLLSVFVFMTLTLPKSGESAVSPDFLRELQRAGAPFGLVGVLGMVFLFILAAKEKWTRQFVQRCAERLPEALSRFSLRLYDGLSAGLSSFKSYRAPLVAGLLSIVMWFNGALAIWIMTWSFGFDLPFAAACFQSVTLALAVALPQAPGYVGVWQFAVSKTLETWGVSLGEAQGFAMLFWLLSFMPVTVIGLLMLWREGLRFRELWSQSKGGSTGTGRP